MPERVVLDFDGVLHQYSRGWTGPEPEEPPSEGAVEFCEALMERGYELVVCSSRAKSPEGKAGIENWLERYGFPEMEVTREKRAAIAYVDDRAVPYSSGNWTDCLRRVEELAS